jgi:hypothetical protein
VGAVGRSVLHVRHAPTLSTTPDLPATPPRSRAHGAGPSGRLTVDPRWGCLRDHGKSPARAVAHDQGRAMVHARRLSGSRRCPPGGAGPAAPSPVGDLRRPTRLAPAWRSRGERDG